MAPLKSFSVAIRFSGVRFSYFNINSWGCALNIPPGDRAFTRISGERVVASQRVS